MKIEIITEKKSDFATLLSLADDPRFIAEYLEKGWLWALYDEDCRAACLVTESEENGFEIQNLSVREEFQGHGYGRKMMEFISQRYSPLVVRTDEFTAAFYEKCGFRPYRRVKNYFPEKYGHRVFDKGRELIDNVYLKNKH